MKPHLISRKAPLEERISVLLNEIDAFILERAKEIQLDGLPIEQCLLMLNAAGCPCRTALKIVETRQQDAFIAECGLEKERIAARRISEVENAKEVARERAAKRTAATA